jgi:hypothetical protein
MQSILRPVDTVLNFGIRNMFTVPCLDYPSYSHRPSMDKFGTGTNFICAIPLDYSCYLNANQLYMSRVLAGVLTQIVAALFP